MRRRGACGTIGCDRRGLDGGSIARRRLQGREVALGLAELPRAQQPAQDLAGAGHRDRRHDRHLPGGDRRPEPPAGEGDELARSLGADEKTARRYLDILAGAFMVRVLPPWFENLKKRQIKAPKIYVRDSGLLHALLGLETHDDLAGHPKRGASWEGFAIEQLAANLDTRDTYFWGTHAGAELDLMTIVRGKRHGFECKYADAPGTTRSMRIALDDPGVHRADGDLEEVVGHGRRSRVWIVERRNWWRRWRRWRR